MRSKIEQAPMSQTKIRIPHATDPSIADIVGILQRASPHSSTRGKPVTLIIHGQLAHKDQTFHRRLADTLARERGWDTFRYDLRGQGGETEGPWIMGEYHVDADDLTRVIEYLQQEFGYRIHLIVAHSRGSLVSTYYLSCREHAHIPLFVNVSGRYIMRRMLENKLFMGGINKDGHFDWHLKIGGKKHVQRITLPDMQQFANWNNTYLKHSFPQDIDVLTVHGDKDEAVPVSDAYCFEEIYKKRSPGTHTLSVTSGDGHNYRRPFDEPCNSIMEWLAKVDPVKKPIEKL